MKILSLGAGMQSTALALMSCENALSGTAVHPLVPIYDAVIFCDLGFEPPWVARQVKFCEDACAKAHIPFYILDCPLYDDFKANFGERRTISIPWWTLDTEGRKSKMPRNCTLDYKVDQISKFVRWTLLGYKKGQRLHPEDIKAHEMHMGFGYEEKRRCHENPNRMFVNRFPLVDMEMTRADNYAYILEKWGLETKASACNFCPFHQNYFFQHLKENAPPTYNGLLEIDKLLQDKTPCPPMKSELFISKSRKRLDELTPEDCDDAQCFTYRGQQIWNGF